MGVWVGGGGGAPQCCMSILRNGLCLYISNFHVDLKIAKCCLSNLGKGPISCRIFSHADKLLVTCRF